MIRSRWFHAVVLGAILASASHGADFGYGSSEEDARLKQVDARLLEVQRQRFAARFFPGKGESREQLDERFRELQKQRRKLLRGTGRDY